jgi:hypothetical protein
MDLVRSAAITPGISEPEEVREMRSANRPKTGKRKIPMTAFQPGQSGNPGGRPKRTPQEFELIEACREKAPTALNVIETLMRSAKKESVRLDAAIFLIERGYGKAIEKIEQLQNPLEETSTAVLLAMRDHFSAKLQAQPKVLAYANGS